MAANESRMRGDMNERSATPTNQSYANPEKERSSETDGVDSSETDGCEIASQGVSVGFCSPYWRHADDPTTSPRDSTVWDCFRLVNHGHPRSRDNGAETARRQLASPTVAAETYSGPRLAAPGLVKFA